MPLQTRLGDFITAVGTDYKQLRTWLTGSNTGTLVGLTTTAKTDLVAAVNEVNAKPSSVPADASETVKGIAQIATQTETNTGTNDAKFITPLKFQTRMTAFAQPLSTNLTNLSGVASTTFGRERLADADAASTKNALGLAPVASSGSATDITTGILPTSVLPPLAISDVFTVASQAAMLALVAERGDVAIRSDVNRTYILATNSPGTLADWKLMTAGGDVLSVAGRVGAVTLARADVGLANVDNISDVNKPVSTAQSNADNLRMLKTNNLSDVANAATSRTNLAVYSQTEMGNPETDLVNLYNVAKI
jgi:hypothetical protein